MFWSTNIFHWLYQYWSQETLFKPTTIKSIAYQLRPFHVAFHKRLRKVNVYSLDNQNSSLFRVLSWFNIL